MSSKLAAAFEEGGSDEDYGDDEFEEGQTAQVQAQVQGKSILAQAAAQVQAETRVEAQTAMRSEADLIAVSQEKSERGAMVLDAMKSALHDSSDEEEDEDEDQHLNTALRVAVWRSELNKASGLVDKGANPWARDRHGWTALHWACKGGDASCVDLLVQAVKNRRSNVGVNKKVAEKEVKEKKVNVGSFLNAQDSLCGWTAMHVACINARKDAVKALMTLGAAADRRDKAGDAPVDCIPAAARNAKHLKRLFGVEELEQVERGGERKDNDSGDEREGERRRNRAREEGKEEKSSREEKQ